MKSCALTDTARTTNRTAAAETGHQPHLGYRYRQGEGEWRDIEQPIPITWSPCRYGGQRPYFICPGGGNGVSCNRRVIKLNDGGPYFLCRNCYGLAYQSQRENPRDRLLSKAQGIRLKLGGSANISLSFPPKPKGMWQRTYERHRATACALEAAMWTATAQWLDNLSKGSGHLEK